MTEYEIAALQINELAKLFPSSKLSLVIRHEDNSYKNMVVTTDNDLNSIIDVVETLKSQSIVREVRA